MEFGGSAGFVADVVVGGVFGDRGSGYSEVVGILFGCLRVDDDDDSPDRGDADDADAGDRYEFDCVRGLVGILRYE